MKSGDVLVFDPSSKAVILHGVDDVLVASDVMVWEGKGKRFGMLRESRFGVQCRVSFG